jgi:DNA-directed RNA polymerase specialized sigma24 family protein
VLTAPDCRAPARPAGSLSVMAPREVTDDGFAALVADVGPRVKRALVAAYGPLVGRDAADDAMSWAWEHRDRVAGLANPGAYLFRVGQTAVKRMGRRARPVPVPAPDELPSVEPALAAAVAALSPRQRAAVLLVHGEGWSLREAAEIMDVSVATLRAHVDRAMVRLRAALGVEHADH